VGKNKVSGSWFKRLKAVKALKALKALKTLKAVKALKAVEAVKALKCQGFTPSPAGLRRTRGRGRSSKVLKF